MRWGTQHHRQHCRSFYQLCQHQLCVQLRRQRDQLHQHPPVALLQWQDLLANPSMLRRMPVYNRDYKNRQESLQPRSGQHLQPRSRFDRA
jgi:hypothetical protein